MVALVTGHRGFIGRHAAAALRATGWNVVGAGRPDVHIPSTAFAAALTAAEPELVVHCAGPASVPAAEADPGADRHASVGVLADLLDALSALAHPPKLLLVSSAAVYGNPSALPVPADAPAEPISEYGRNRVACEELVLTSPLRVAIARIFSAYGEGLQRQVWWDIARRARSGEVTLSGTGAESRDFVHGEDVGRGLATVAGAARFDGDVLNVATGVETTIAELAERLTACVNPRAAITFTGETRAGDPRRWRADIAPLRAAGFEPRVAIAEGVERYARWVVTQ